jgi:hypothetical protein
LSYYVRGFARYCRAIDPRTDKRTPTRAIIPSSIALTTAGPASSRASKNAIFGLNSLPGFWTQKNPVYCLWTLDFGPNSGGPKSGQGKLADLDALSFFLLFPYTCIPESYRETAKRLR